LSYAFPTTVLKTTVAYHHSKRVRQSAALSGRVYPNFQGEVVNLVISMEMKSFKFFYMSLEVLFHQYTGWFYFFEIPQSRSTILKCSLYTCNDLAKTFPTPFIGLSLTRQRKGVGAASRRGGCASIGGL